jgi:RHS repeat-associated protein
VRNWIPGGVIALLIALGSPGLSMAQSQPVPPDNYTLDPRGVDLVTGDFNYSTTDVTIGQPTAGGLSYGRTYTIDGWRDNFAGGVSISGADKVVSVGPVSETFVFNGSEWVSKYSNGSTYALSGTLVTVTDKNGNQAIFDQIGGADTNPYGASEGLIRSYSSPNGEIISYHYGVGAHCTRRAINGVCIVSYPIYRLSSVTNNYGYMIKYEYWSNVDTVDQWYRVKTVTGINSAVDYCDPVANSCGGFTQVWPSASYDNVQWYRNLAVTDQSGRTTAYTYGPTGMIHTVRSPGATSDQLVVDYNPGPDFRVNKVTDASGEWNYVYAAGGSTQTTTVTGPAGQSLAVLADMTIQRATSVTDGLGRIWSYQYDGDLRTTRITNPESDYTQYAYDARGNPTTTTSVAKPGSGLSNIVTSAAYPASCSSPYTPANCNKPVSTTDARGNVTDYVWDGTYGVLTSVTAPAPSPGADRPQTRYAYSGYHAWYRNSAGTIVQDPAQVVLPDVVSTCATGTAPACIGTAAETRQTTAYGSSGVANNLLPTSSTSGDGTGTLAVTTAMTWTPDGDPATVDGPLSGSGDTTRFLYDTARQRVGIIGPDPDAGGGLLNRAQRITYDARGQVALVETGTTPGYSDANWSSFATLQRQATDYDAYGRPVVARSQDAAGNTLALQQVGYDAAGRPECAATRMNPGAFAGLPGATGACSQTALGASGPDRIVQTAYDAASRPVSTTSGVGSGSTITESVAYTANGKPLSLTDGNGNVSTYAYDGFDRVFRQCYPGAATCASATPTDYEQYGYDAASNVATFQNRAGQTIGLGYDALNRRVTMGGSAISDRTFAYDNLSRPTATDFNGGGSLSTNTWDALSRLTSQSQNGLGTVSYGYDNAGRRVWVGWPDFYYVAYDWNLYGQPVAIRENGATSGVGLLATYTYDDLGRHTVTGRGNGVWSSYGYDGVSRLAWMNNDPAGTAQDVSWLFGYNPAGQIVSRSVSNTAYVYTPTSSAVAYTNNILNRLTAINGSGVGYDALGDIASAPGATYGYNAESQLTSSTTSLGSAAFAYDPTGRLYQSTGSATRRYLYDGQQVIAEYDGSGVLQNRYVPGLGLDDVVVSYDAGGNRTWLLSDERRSVVALTDGSGVAGSINTYDEYGVPSASNAGRFQYTGQMWLPDAQLYHYRARAYAPQIGRFLQPDPMGYGAGANLYGYVGADPVNLVDPQGLGPEDPGDTWTCYQGMICDPPTKMGQIVVTARERGCSHRANFCLSGDDLKYIDIGISGEIVIVAGYVLQTGFTYVVDISGEHYSEVGRCQFASRSPSVGLGVGAGPTASWQDGAPRMSEKVFYGELSFFVFSAGADCQRGHCTPSGSLGSNPAENILHGNSSIKPSIGIKAGSKMTRRFNCEPAGSY